MTDLVELKPCPFCGSDGDDLMVFCDPDEGLNNSGPSRRIQCSGCHIEVPYYPSEAEAVATWNARAAIRAVEADMRDRAAKVADRWLDSSWIDERQAARRIAEAIRALPLSDGESE